MAVFRLAGRYAHVINLDHFEGTIQRPHELSWKPLFSQYKATTIPCSRRCLHTCSITALRL